MMPGSMTNPDFQDPAAIQRLRDAIYATKEFRSHLPNAEPDWTAILAPLNLATDTEHELTACLRRLRLLTFTDFETVKELLVFNFTRLPRLHAQHTQARDDRGIRLCALFQFFLKMAMQGSSLFPQNPALRAEQVRAALEAPARNTAHLDALLELLLHTEAVEPDAGFNVEEAANPDAVVLSEHHKREGMAEWAWQSRHKYDDFKLEVIASPKFQADWAALKRRFRIKSHQDSKGVIRRSPIPENNWQRPTHPVPPAARAPFQVAFDFFCWKWFLYGMRHDEPLPEKLSVTLTPSGTQIFIPGYWNLDHSRDIKWKEVMKLHQARGIGKQGPKLAANRRQRVAQLQRLLVAEKEAKRLGLHGEPRKVFLKKEAGLAAETDDRQLRRLLAEARATLLKR